MGRFDTLHCDYPLPDPEFQNEDFQTKDLGETLGHYRITKDGRLWRLPRRVNPFAKDTPSSDAADEPEDTNYHGDLYFYTGTDKEWIEYDARFTYGTVDWIHRPGEPEPVPDDSLERLARNAAALEQGRTAVLLALLARLEVLDPEIAERVIMVIADRLHAARWLATSQHSLGDATPYQVLLAQGGRQAVLEELERIERGIFS